MADANNEDAQFEPEPNTLVVEDESLRKGFVLIPRRVLYAHNLSHSAKILYAVLLGYAWQEGSCFPGFRRLADDMGATEKTVRKYMTELRDARLLSQKRRGLNKTNIYFIHKLETAKLQSAAPSQSGAVNLTVQEGKKARRGNNYRSRTATNTAQERENLPPNNKQSNSNQSNNKQQQIAVDVLKEIGITEPKYSRILSNHSEEFILEKFNILVWYVRNNKDAIKKTPAAFLIHLIENDVPPPDGMTGSDDSLWRVIDTDTELRKRLALEST